MVFISLLFFACEFNLVKIDGGPGSGGGDGVVYPEPYAEPKEVVTVSSVEQLLFHANRGNVTILLEDGTYNLNSLLLIKRDNVTIRSKSGNRDSVVLKGKGMTGAVQHVFLVRADYFSLKDVTISDVYYHGIQVQGEQDADHIYLKNVVFRDIRQQMLKVSYDKSRPEINSDFGIVEDCLFEYTAGKGYYWYCGGIDVHKGNNWVIRGNTFRNIISPEARLAEGAIHFWSNSRNTKIENNRIINCGRGIMLGLDSSAQFGGIVRNNFIHVVRDTGIYLCNTRDVAVYNNTVYNHNSWNGSTYANSIEYRFAATSALTIRNNLTNRAIRARNGATALLSANRTDAAASWFVNAPAGDLHLASYIGGVVGKGVTIPELKLDIDGEQRGVPCDIGADEL